MKVLITGATSGIGYQVGKTIAERGHFVYMTTHTQKQLESLKTKVKEIEGAVICFVLDITKPNTYSKLDKLDLDCLIAHAGVGQGGSLLDLPLEKVRENFDTNFFGTLSLIQYLLPTLSKKKNARILVTSSIGAHMSIPFLGSYCATKAALTSLIKSLRQELKLVDTELQIGLIEPGIYKTGFNEVMLENKSPYFEQSSYFKEKEKIRKRESFLFSFFGKKKLNSIVKKITHEVESSYVKKISRSPLLQRIAVKLYLLFLG